MLKQAKKAPARRSEDERWNRDIATLRQAAQELAERRNVRPRLRLANSPFEQTAQLLDDPSAEVREKAVRDLYEMDPDQAATLVNDALRDGSVWSSTRLPRHSTRAPGN